MNRLWNGIKAFFVREWTLEEKVLVILCCTLIGVVKGFMLAPIKKGISCGNNNGNYYEGQDEDDCCCCEE